jgi:hypothetical protein
MDNFAVSSGFRLGASMKNKTLLMFWSSLELPAGIALIAAPSRVAKLLISAGLTPGGEAVGRLGGCALFSLAIACWPRADGDHTQPIRALFLYNIMAACYLGYLKIGGEFSSFLLLPACGLHGLLALLFIRPVYESAVGKGSI